MATSLIFALFSEDEAALARELGEDTLRRCRRVPGANHARTLRAATALTLVLVQRGKAEAARELG